MFRVSSVLLCTIRFLPLLILFTGELRNFVTLSGKVQASPISSNFEKIPQSLLFKNNKERNETRNPPPYDLDNRSPMSVPTTTTSVPKVPPWFTEEQRELIDILPASIHGLRVEDVSKGITYDQETGISNILAESPAFVRIFGEGFTKHTVIRFVTEKGDRGMDCDDLESTKSFPLIESNFTPYSALTIIFIPPLYGDDEVYYICARQNNTDQSWIHQGTEPWIQIRTYEPFLPIWSEIIMIIILLILSGLFSGLNLGLMSLDRTEMKIIAATGTEKERRYAKTIQPLRDNGNYLLCTLLLGNVMVNSTLTILLDDLSSGLIAVIAATISIVLFGEIIPQAICSRHGLAVGARTVWLTKFFMAITFPMSYPISVFLDKILGEEIGSFYNRERLKELIRVTDDYNDLEKDEVNIIAGALELKQKVVGDVMTKLEDIFMLPTDAVLDFDTVSEIMSQGYSRVPIYDGMRCNLVSVLYTKDLAFVDPDDKMPLRTICDFYSNPIMYVFETTTLDIVFRDFKTGNKGHMAFAQRVSEGEKGSSDPYYEITGLVTMEDVIEALIKAEINDETDVYDSMRRRRSKTHLTFSLTSRHIGQTRWKCDDIHVSPQLILAAFQYLSTSVEEFNCQRISKTILQRLLNQNLFFQIKVKKPPLQHDRNDSIYERGKPADYFVLILEGRVQVEMGRENLVFESGPFSFFGVHILNQNIGIGDGQIPTTPSEMRKMGSASNSLECLLGSTFVPDYTVRPVVCATFLKISRSMYLAAKQATVLEKTHAVTDDCASQNEVGENFQYQIDQMMSSEKASNNNFNNRNSTIVPNKINTPNIKPRRRNSDVLSEILLRPSDLIGGYDKPAKISTGSRKQSMDNNLLPSDKNVTFQDQPTSISKSTSGNNNDDENLENGALNTNFPIDDVSSTNQNDTPSKQDEKNSFSL